MAAAIALLGASAVTAQVHVPDHDTTISADGSSCTVAFRPFKSAGDALPILYVSKQDKAGSWLLQMSVTDADSFTTIDVVYNNTRTSLTPFEEVFSEDVDKEPLWGFLDKAAKDELPFVITARTEIGQYSSVRYTQLSPDAITSILKTDCAKGGGGTPAKSDDALASAENDLGLTFGQLRHIRWVLQQKYGDNKSAPGNKMNDKLRGFLEQYAASKGLTPTRYLDKQLSSRLLKEKFKPVRQNFRGMPGYLKHRDWASFMSKDRSQCIITSFAKRQVKHKTYRHPRIEIRAVRGDPSNMLDVRFAIPHRFSQKHKVVAIVDGREYRLRADKEFGILIPTNADGVVRSDVVRAIRLGKKVIIRGKSQNGKRNIALHYSALGFGLAFQTMAENCGRGRLYEWITR